MTRLPSCSVVKPRALLICTPGQSALTVFFFFHGRPSCILIFCTPCKLWTFVFYVDHKCCFKRASASLIFFGWPAMPLACLLPFTLVLRYFLTRRVELARVS